MRLFHVTASPDWSSLPLSGLFVQMLERLTQSAGGLATEPETLAGAMWAPQQVLDGFGDLGPPSLVAGVPGERLAEARPSPETPPGIYASGDRQDGIDGNYTLQAGNIWTTAASTLQYNASHVHFFTPDFIADICGELGLPSRPNGHRWWLSGC